MLKFLTGFTGSGPTVLVIAVHASAEDFEEGLDLRLGMRAIDDCEGAASQGGVHLADIVAGGFLSFDNHCWWRRGKAGEEVENPGAGFFDLAWAVIEGEGEIDYSDVDWVRFDDALGGVC